VKPTVHVEEEGLDLVASSFFLSLSSISLRNSSSVLFACLFNVELIMFGTSLREGDGLGRTSGVTSGLVKTIGIVSFENNPLPCHLTMREKELVKISAVRFECLATLLHQIAEGGLEDVALVEVGSVVAGVSTLHASCA
jgi:hypothetical protein